MNQYIIGMIVFAATFGGAMLGMWLRTVLPEHHLNAESKDTVKLGIGLIATMTALVLGLITASAKNSYDAVDAGVKQSAIQVLTLDRALARYGPETAPIRLGLKKAIGARIDNVWSMNQPEVVNLDPMSSGAGSSAELLAEAIRNLQPNTDAQRALQSRALDHSEELLQTRWLVLAGTESSIPLPFLVILLFWLTVTFTSFGLFAPRNGIVHAVFFVCAVSVGSAVFLVVELDQPFGGLIRVSADPLRYALAHLNR